MPPVDIIEMPLLNCAACGADLADSGARFCSSCGVPISTGAAAPAGGPAPETIDTPEAEVPPDPVFDTPDEPTPGPDEPTGTEASTADRPLRRTMTEDQWRYTTWGAVAVGAVAIVALLTVVFGLLSRAEDASAASSERNVATSITTTTIPIADGPTAAAPVTEAVTIESPRIGYPVWYRVGRTAVILTLTMNKCERIDGMLRASGEIRNNSPLGQTLGYRVSVDMTRPLVGTAVASLEATIDGVDAGKTVEWLVETPSTKAVNLRCEIPLLTVAPATDG